MHSKSDASEKAMLVEDALADSDSVKIGPSPPITDPYLYVSKIFDLYKASSGVILGNFLEWYDWSLFGYLERLMTIAFFGTSNTTWLYFAIPFIARPGGSLLFGWLAARSGRKICLIMTVVLMGCSTFFQGCLVPGVAGMLTIQMLLRIVGGVSAGGESISCVTYMSEIGEERDSRLLAAAMSIQVITGSLAFLIASCAALLQFTLTPEEQVLWGWRLPFLATGPLAVKCVYMRLPLPESPVWERMRRNARGGNRPMENGPDGKTYGTLHQMKEGTHHSFSLHDLSLIALVIAMTLPAQIMIYLPMVLASWLHVYLGLSASAAMWVAFVSKLVNVLMVVPVAFLADQRGGIRCVTIGLLGLIATVLPSIMMLMEVIATTSDQSTAEWVATVTLGIIMPFFGTFLMPVELIQTSLFPAARRSQLIGICGSVRGIAMGFMPAAFMALSQSALWVPWVWFTVLATLGLAVVIGLGVGARKGFITVHQRAWLF